MNRRLIIAAVAMLALAVAAFATSGFGLMGKKDAGELSLYGNVDIREVDMAFRVTGRIASIDVEEGAKVERGQLLATIDTASLSSRIAEADARVAQAAAQYAKLRNGNRRQDVAQAEARVSAAAASYVDAEKDFTRRRALVGPGAISRDLWEQTVAQRDRAAAQLNEARQAYSLVASGARPEDIAAAAAEVRSAQAAQRRESAPIWATRG